MPSFLKDTGDVRACDQEPIHIPGSIQPHGMLLVCDPNSLEIQHVSENISTYFNRDVSNCIGQPLSEVVNQQITALAQKFLVLPNPGNRVHYLGDAPADSSPGVAKFSIVAHRYQDRCYLEIEPIADSAAIAAEHYFSAMHEFVSQLESLGEVEELTAALAEHVRSISGYDRALVYRFDEDWTGIVVGESRNDRLPSYMDLRFPASDIPAQARELYCRNRVRMIPDAAYRPVPIHPTIKADGTPIDLSYSTLRSVSPTHVQYMKNMGTMASMSFSIVREGRLWGLVSCHNATPRWVPFAVRNVCDSLTHIYGVQLQARERVRMLHRGVELACVQSLLLEVMAASDSFHQGIVENPKLYLKLFEATGGAVVHQGRISLIGKTPAHDQVAKLAEWLDQKQVRDVFATDAANEVGVPALASKETPAEAGTPTLDWHDPGGWAAGFLAISISALHRSYLIWFRPELIRTVKWGGDPRKLATANPDDRLSPRRSFDQWRETVRGKSAPWEDFQLQAAADFRIALARIVLKRAEELAQLNSELERTNRELEAFSYSVSHDLRAPFRHIVGYSELLKDLEAKNFSETGSRYLDTIMRAANFAGSLVDNLLNLSHIGRTELKMQPIDMDAMIRDTVRELGDLSKQRHVEWQLARLPLVQGDPILVRLLVRNLLENALKFTRSRDPAVIAISGDERSPMVQFQIRDNGIGFEMRYAEKLFGVFERLHRVEEYEGTGIGLANVRRIVERHGGKVWAEAELNRGATFHFTLPRFTQ